MINDGLFTPDGYAVNDLDSANFNGNTTPLLPSLNDSNPNGPNYMPNIGDRLNGANIPWRWYAEGWDAAVAGHASPNFVFHHQAFVYFDNFVNGSYANNLKDLDNYHADLAAGKLPSVSFLKAESGHDEHPGQGAELPGQQWAVDQITALQNSTSWANSSLILTYDENGGHWDHVQPVAKDRWGTGSRVPSMIISPFAKRSFVDSMQYETVSIDKTLEQVSGLAPLSSRDTAATAMYHSYTFSPTDIRRNNLTTASSGHATHSRVLTISKAAR